METVVIAEWILYVMKLLIFFKKIMFYSKSYYLILFNNTT
jgi:hypothetical protein